MGKKDHTCYGKWYCILAGLLLIVWPILSWLDVLSYRVPTWELVLCIIVGVVGVVIGVMMKCDTCCEKKGEPAPEAPPAEQPPVENQ